MEEEVQVVENKTKETIARLNAAMYVANSPNIIDKMTAKQQKTAILKIYNLLMAV